MARYRAMAQVQANGRIYEPGEEFDYDGPQSERAMLLLSGTPGKRLPPSKNPYNLPSSNAWRTAVDDGAVRQRRD